MNSLILVNKPNYFSKHTTEYKKHKVYTDQTFTICNQQSPNFGDVLHITKLKQKYFKDNHQETLLTS